MRWDKSYCVCSRAFDNLPTPVNWWGTGQTLGAWGRLKTALPGSKGSVRGTTTRGQTSVVSSEGQWYLTSSSVTQLMARSAVPAALHTENCEQFKHQRVVTTLRSASKRWADSSPMQFTEKCKVLCLWRNNPMQEWNGLETKQPEKKLCRRGLKLKQAEHQPGSCTCKGHQPLGCTRTAVPALWQWWSFLTCKF